MHALVLPVSVVLLQMVVRTPPVMAATFPDWLVTNITTPTQLVSLSDGTLRLTNGLIRRDFVVKPDFATVDLFSYEKNSSVLRALSMEAHISLNGHAFSVGGIKLPYRFIRAYLDRTLLRQTPAGTYQGNFHYFSHKILKPQEKFPYKPNFRRGAPQHTKWPPKGLRLDVIFKPDKHVPKEFRTANVTIHYEMYDGIPLMTKWLTVAGPADMRVSVSPVETLAVNQQWADGQAGQVGLHWPRQAPGWLYVETDQTHGTVVRWHQDPEQKMMRGSYEAMVECSYEMLPNALILGGFESFRVHELLVGSSEPERLSLAKHQMQRLLAPQSQEAPMFFHMMKGATSNIKTTIDKVAEVGFDMVVYSFGSGINIESTDEEYIKHIAEAVAYANSKGVEVGAYDLIATTRKVATELMAVGGKGACFASGWYDHLLDRVLNFLNKTGMTMVETDGTYAGYTCNSTNHTHHTGREDSVYWQQKLQGDFFSILQGRGIYINSPLLFFYQGSSKSGMGYDEWQYSLPRWQDISISRQTVYDGTYNMLPTSGWMLVPLRDYHSGGPKAEFEPLHEHLQEFEWVLAQNMGAGVAAAYRGDYIYDTNETKAVVKKWGNFYQKYRDILTSDIIHVKWPDMQSIDSFMHVNPFLPIKGLAMVFNPTDENITTTLTLPLYYTGLTPADKANIREQEGPSKGFQLDSRSQVLIPVNLPSRNITWFVVE